MVAFTGVAEPKSLRLKILLIILCTVVLAITLSAGLWPFSFKKANQVWWRPEAQGLFLGDYGMLISGSTFSQMPEKEAGGHSIEIWIEPGLTWDSNTILTFYDPSHPATFVVRQNGDNLSFSKTRAGEHEQGRLKSLFVDHVFRKGQRLLLTFTSSRGDLNVYLNGALTKRTDKLAITDTDFRGTLVVGNSPYGNSSLSATFLGLAFYNRALTPDEVREDYAKWQNDRRQMAIDANPPETLYLFNEQAGTIVHNVGTVGPDLVIPAHYFILEPAFLQPFWKEFRASWAYAEDIAINILGLVPLGLCFSALFAWLLGTKQALLRTVIFGFCVSLMIEILQAFIPTRLSGTTDLMTNTLGTAMGGWMYLNKFTQTHLRKSGLIHGDLQ